MFRIRDLVSTYVMVCLLALMAHSAPLSAAEEQPKPQTLFTNVNVFDGKSDTLAEGMSVLVEGNLIKKIAKGDIETDANATVIDGGGRILMPGLHDMHTHVGIFRPVAGDNRIDMSPFLVGAVSAARAEGMLMNGFTLIRDIGGPAKFLQRAIDAGVVVGPRVLPSENFVTQTSGHGDFRNRTDPNPNIDVRGSTNYIDEYYSCFADGRPRFGVVSVNSSQGRYPDQDFHGWRRCQRERSAPFGPVHTRGSAGRCANGSAMENLCFRTCLHRCLYSSSGGKWCAGD